MTNKEFQQTMAKLNFVRSSNHLGQSFAIDCSFWETKYNGMFITDYDISNHWSALEEDLLCLFFRYNGIAASEVISSEIITDSETLQVVIESFYESIKSKYPERIK